MYLCQRVSWVEEGELVPLEALHVLHHQREVSHSLEAQLRLQGVQHVLGRDFFVRIFKGVMFANFLRVNFVFNIICLLFYKGAL